MLILLAAQASAVDAERAFAADARKLGQWTAFRKWATEDATMFWPQPVNAQEKLKTLPDPPKSIEWKPARSFVSCDGTTAANTGPWRSANGQIGYFSTIWAKQPDGGWKWTVDGGDAVKEPRFVDDAEPETRRAACGGKVRRVEPPLALTTKVGGGESPDATLAWLWEVSPDGARTFTVHLWNGREMARVIDDRIAASPPRPATPPRP